MEVVDVPDSLRVVEAEVVEVVTISVGADEGIDVVVGLGDGSFVAGCRDGKDVVEGIGVGSSDG